MGSTPQKRLALCQARGSGVAERIGALGRAALTFPAVHPVLVNTTMQQARRHKSKLILCGMQDRVRSIFEIARLDMVFTILSDVEEAKAS